MKYFLGFLIAIALIAGVFILVLRSFSHAPAKSINLLDYTDTDTVMQLQVDGKINADSIHQAYSITVGRDFATIETTKGYQGTAVVRKSYPNTINAYAAFLRALQLQGFVKGDPTPARADNRGYCPDGQRYNFKIITDTKVVENYWSTSCGKGTYGGNSAITRQLFLRQIPDASRILNGFDS